MFAKRGPLVSLAQRKVQVLRGEKELDYKIDGNRGGVFLYTADQEQLTKGKKHIITLIAQLRPTDRFLAVKVNPELYRLATVTGPNWIDQEDDGSIVLNIIPRVDINLAELEYIVKLLVEGISA